MWQTYTPTLYPCLVKLGNTAIAHFSNLFIRNIFVCKKLTIILYRSF
jgi:hypothetical protein